MLPVRQRPFSQPLSAKAPLRARPHVRVAAQNGTRESVPIDLALLVALTSVTAAPAYAGVDETVGAAVDSVRAVGEAAKSGIGLGERAIGFLKEAYARVSPKVNELVDQATPVVKQTFDDVQRVATPIAKDASSKAVPIVTEGTRNLLKSSGVDVDALTSTATSASKQVGEYVDKATPTLNKVTQFISTSSPENLAKYAAAAVAAYYLAPFAAKSLVSSVRGYAGEITPARAVDVVASDSNAAVIDIRSQKEKQAVGVPEVPSSARGRFIELEIAEVDRRLRGQLKNVDGVEAQVTALEIQALKKVNRGTRILLLDRSGAGPAKAVAKELAKLGFGKAFVISGGFSGWTSSKLQIKSPVSGGKAGSSPIANILGTISTRKPTPQEAAGRKK